MTSTEYEIKENERVDVSSEVLGSGSRIWQFTVGNMDYWSYDKDHLARWLLTNYLALRHYPESST